MIFKDFIKDYDWSRVTELEAPGCIDEPDAPPVKFLIAVPKENWTYKKNSPCILIIPGGGLSTCFRVSAPIEEDVIMHDELVKFDEMIKNGELLAAVEKVVTLK